ncbi:glycosyltransferase [uncultured Bacteroides sp.]|uniref:glycosyltransferase n=1 Tax=uncultured Bacteroides sp. TaxID=162156 RepID=UPI0025D353FF|nr:glycosyltransferase [uncultured Bacteroides sp.]
MTKKKVLIVASVVSFIEWFNKENVDYINKIKKCELHIACNFDYMEDTDEGRTRAYIQKISSEGVILHNICFVRSPFCSQNLMCYKHLKRIIDENNFNLIHVHTPTVGILTRFAARNARKRGTIVMYTCHGFHFHKAAPWKNWIMFYPIERFMSRFCDYIVTINKEDYNRSKTFYAPFVHYIPGVGVDINRIHKCKVDRRAYKCNLGVPEDCILILSIGEMIERKNHEVVIRALGMLHDSKIYYAICGKGPLKEHLACVAKTLGIAEKVKFLGFRKDIPELCNTADISAFPSRIEGLGLAGIEAMAAGVPLISSDVHGILDYVIDGKTGYTCKPNDIEGFAKAIAILANDEKLRNQMAASCWEAVAPFEIENALHEMWKIYDEILGKT